MNTNALIIFAKFPEKGKVKTRLAASTSEKFALEFYKLLLDKFATLANDIGKKQIADVYIYFNRMPTTGEDFNFSNPMKICEQTGNNLGEKMNNAFNNIFSAGHKNAVIIGTDIPDLDSRHITDAFRALSDNKFVIGPAEDGGYYLLGMNQPSPELFENINWSTNTVLNETLQKIKPNKYTLLEKLIDIDTIEELNMWIIKKDKYGELIRQISNLREEFKV